MLACNIYKVTINNTITSFILFENYSIIRFFLNIILIILFKNIFLKKKRRAIKICHVRLGLKRQVTQVYQPMCARTPVFF
jgi:hypothetical protein